LRIFIFLLLFTGKLLCQDINATYKISFGIFGQIGIAKANLHVKNNHYTITMKAYTTGFAKALSGNRQEYFVSKGNIIKKILLPDVYKKVVKRKKNRVTFSKSYKILKEDTRIYTFNHATKSIYLYKESKIDSKVDSHSSEILKYYAKNDLLSLFFNFKQIAQNLSENLFLKAVGANKKDGRINIQRLSENKKIQKEFSWPKGEYFKVIIYDKIFASKQGELFVNLNKKGIAQNAILKDVILFGDIRGDLIE
jgi:hypothetical protein